MTFTAVGAVCVACNFSLGMLQTGVARLGAQGARAHPPGPGAVTPGPVRFVAGACPWPVATPAGSPPRRADQMFGTTDLPSYWRRHFRLRDHPSDELAFITDFATQTAHEEHNLLQRVSLLDHGN